MFSARDTKKLKVPGPDFEGFSPSGRRTYSVYNLEKILLFPDSVLFMKSHSNKHSLVAKK